MAELFKYKNNKFNFSFNYQYTFYCEIITFVANFLQTFNKENQKWK